MSLQERARQARNPQTPGQGIAVAPPTRLDQIQDTLMQRRELVGAGLSKVLDLDVFMGRVMNEIRKNPDLAKCSTPSLMGAVVSMAQLGLEPGPLGHAYLTPRRNSVKVGGRWEKVDEVVLVIGYRGYITLGRRAGGMSIDADAVREGDEFTHVRGSSELLTFRKSLHGERGDVLGYWATATFDGGMATHFMRTDELVAHAEQYVGRNDAGGFKGFAGKNWDAWSRKTVIRQMTWRLPQSNELARAVQVDETPTYLQESGRLVTVTQDGEVIDDNPMTPPPPMSEQPPAQQERPQQARQDEVPLNGETDDYDPTLDPNWGKN